MEPHYDFLRIDTEPRYLQVISEPYVVYTKHGYQPVIDVFEKKQKRPYSLYISAKSLSNDLELLRNENNGRLNGCEFWIRKTGFAKTSSYELT